MSKQAKANQQQQPKRSNIGDSPVVVVTGAGHQLAQMYANPFVGSGYYWPDESASEFETLKFKAEINAVICYSSTNAPYHAGISFCPERMKSSGVIGTPDDPPLVVYAPTASTATQAGLPEGLSLAGERDAYYSNSGFIASLFAESATGKEDATTLWRLNGAGIEVVDIGAYEDSGGAVYGISDASNANVSNASVTNIMSRHGGEQGRFDRNKALTLVWAPARPEDLEFKAYSLSRYATSPGFMQMGMIITNPKGPAGIVRQLQIRAVAHFEFMGPGVQGMMTTRARADPVAANRLAAIAGINRMNGWMRSAKTREDGGRLQELFRALARQVVDQTQMFASQAIARRLLPGPVNALRVAGPPVSREAIEAGVGAADAIADVPLAELLPVVLTL